MSFFKYFIALTALALPLSMTQAATSGSLIKGSLSSVYYLAQDGKRYVFPTERTYKTWYSDFSSVQTVSDSELASYPLGANITYRPGTRLIKVITDPKVYAVGRGGELRWVQTEAVARGLFGDQWSMQVDDLPDTFFTSYRLGAPIALASDFQPANEMAIASSIQTELNARTPATTPPTTTAPTSTSSTPTPTSTSSTPNHTLLLLPSTKAPRNNERVQYQAVAQPSGTVSEIKIYYNGTLSTNCSYTPCSTDIQVSQSYSSSVTAVATARWITGETATVTSTLNIVPGVPGVTLRLKPQVRPGQPREAVITVDSSLYAYNIDIYMDGSNVRGCSTTQECRYSETETAAIGTTHEVYAIVRDSGGHPFRSETQTFQVVQNEAPILTLDSSKTFIYAGESMDVSVNASDDDGVTETQIYWKGTLIKQCVGATCNAMIGPVTERGFVQFVGKAMDTRGNIGSATSTAVQVQ